MKLLSSIYLILLKYKNMIQNSNPGKVHDLLSSLDFNLDMAPSIKNALESSGINSLRTQEFPGLKQWRENVTSFGLAVAATTSPYDALVNVDDRLIPLAGSDTKLRLRIYEPINKQERLPVFYWMHGGGLMGGTPEQDDIQMKEIVAKTNCIVVSVAYRLAPEHPFPVPLNDCYEGLIWICNNAKELGINKQRIAIGGASAGGGLATALVLKVRKSGGPQLVHQSLTYPMLDPSNTSNSSFQITNLGVWDRSFNLIAWQAYLGVGYSKNIIPEFASATQEKDLSGLPAAFIAVGALDLFRDEDIEYALRLMEAGVSTELHFYPGAVHGFDWHVPNDPMTTSLLGKRINALRMAFEIQV
jgi:acetyl esterase/lipase